MDKKNTRRFIVAAALITLIGGCVGLYFREPRFLADPRDIGFFVLTSPISLAPFWIALTRTTNSNLANSVLVLGSLLIGCAGAALYFLSLVTNGKAESIFMVLIVPAAQLVAFIFLWGLVTLFNPDN